MFESKKGIIIVANPDWPVSFFQFVKMTHIEKQNHVLIINTINAGERIQEKMRKYRKYKRMNWNGEQ